MNKKGGVFGLLMVVGLIVVLSFSIYMLNVGKEKISSEVDSPLRILELNAIKENFFLYNNESIRLSSQQAYYELSKETKKLFPSGCSTYLGFVIINENCLIEKEKIETIFLENFKLNYQKLLNLYPTTKIQDKMQEEIIYFSYKPDPKFEIEKLNNNLHILSNNAEMNISRKTNFIEYTYIIKINQQSDFDLNSIGIYLDDFQNTIKDLNQQAKICKQKPTNEVITCMNTLKSQNFIISYDINGDYIIATINTKEKLFFEENNFQNFDKIPFYFAIPRI